MTIPRYRIRGPEFLPKELIGTHYMNSKTCPLQNWVKVGECVYPNSATYIKSYQTCFDETHPGPPYRVGGPFFLKRKGAEFLDSQSGTYSVQNLFRYSGRFRVSLPSTDPLATVYNSYTNTASSFGAQAWNAFRPVKPTASLGQDFYEVRDFEKLLKATVKRFQDLGSLYLAVQFGWRPFLKSLLDVASTMSKLDRKIRFVRKNNGKWITRGGKLRNSSTMTQTFGGVTQPGLRSAFYVGGSPNPVQKTVVETDRIWFKARMKYYIQDLDVDPCDSVLTSKLLRKFYGLEITPALVWELLPFSWFHDWVVNYGDVISNFANSGYDNLVAKYAYVMRHRRTDVYLDWRQGIMDNGGCGTASPRSVSTQTHYWVECKERAEGNPWGFGGEEGDLSPYRLSILFALGLQSIRV